MRRFFDRATLLTYLSLLLSGCSVFNPASKDHKQDLQEPSPECQTRFPAGLLNTLQVALEASPVFLEPKRSASTFGPLTLGEPLKWLDARDGWVRVWIPRLRVSGWLPQSNVEEVQNGDPNLPPVPVEELTTLIVLWERIHVREGPSTKSDVVLTAGKDEAFFLLGEREGWCQVWLPDQKRRGWISAKGLVRKAGK